MQHLKYKGEHYSCCAPRHITEARGTYTCDAWKIRTGKVVRNHGVLNGLGQILARRKEGVNDEG